MILSLSVIVFLSGIAVGLIAYPGRITPAMWILMIVGLALNSWVDRYHPSGFLLDPFLLYFLYKQLRKSATAINKPSPNG